MKTYRVKWDYKKAAWSKAYKFKFGEHNEGFLIQGDSLPDVCLKLETTKNLNPFYLEIKEVTP
jgi:hypothetical protein